MSSTTAAEGKARGGRADLLALSGLTVAWWASVLVVDPSGDFPLNDDWGYAPAVRALVEDGALRFTDWQSMPLLTHVLWGALFCMPGGFSHEALRASTLVAGWLGVLAVYGLLAQLRAPRSVRAVAAATVLVNPIYFGLAHTFMTDVPFVAALTAATAAWVRAEETSRTRWYVAATALTLWATLNRQLGLALPIAWTLVSALRHGLGRRWLTTALLPAAVVAGALFGYERIVDATLGLPGLYHRKGHELGQALADLLRLRGLRYPLERATYAPLYLGLFASPLILVSFRWLKRDWLARILPLLGGSSAALAAGLGAALPLVGNVWIDLGMGPRTAPGLVEGASPKLWIVLTTAAGVCAGFLFVALHVGAWRTGVLGHAPLRRWPRRLWEGLRGRAGADEPGGPMPAWQWLLTLVTALVAFVPVSLVYGPFFDRYLLLQLPFVLVSLWAAADRREAPGRWTSIAAGLLLVVGLGYSVAATHDYLAWQRARWAAVERLEARSVAPGDVRGGFEVDNHPPGDGFVERTKSDWAVAIAPLHDHDTVERVEVDAWLPHAVEEVLILRRRPKRR